MSCTPCQRFGAGVNDLPVDGQSRAVTEPAGEKEGHVVARGFLSSINLIKTNERDPPVFFAGQKSQSPFDKGARTWVPFATIVPPGPLGGRLTLPKSYYLKGRVVLEKKTCACKNGGCGKNAVPERISVTLGDREVTNRDLICRKCVYKKRGDTAACLRYEKKPESVFSGECAFYLREEVGVSHGGCSGCSEHGNCGKDACTGCRS